MPELNDYIYHRDSMGEFYLGDCREVMAAMEADSIDTVITDPPYGLSDGQEDVGNVLIATLFDVVFPQYIQSIAEIGNETHLSMPCDRSSLLAFMDRAIWEKAGITMPERTVNFNNRVVFWNEEVKDRDISASTVPDGFLRDKPNTQFDENGLNLFLNLRPCRNAAFGNGATCRLAESGNGLLRVPVVIPLTSEFASFLRTLSPSNSTFLCHMIRLLYDPLSYAKGSSFVMTSNGAELRVMLTLDLRRGTCEFSSASSTDAGDFVFELRCSKSIRTLAAASSLPPMLQPHRISIVGDFTNRACTLYLHKNVIALIKKSRNGFMGKAWDHGVPGVEFWTAILRVAKPGAMLMAFGGTRTHHRLMCAIEDAGWQIRDCILWLYGSGFPKSLDISKAIDKTMRRDYVRAAIRLGLEIPGNSLHDWTKAEHSPSDKWWNKFMSVLTDEEWQSIEREVIGHNNRKAGWFATQDGHNVTAPATPKAQLWNGWGTALKPAYEPIILAMKPTDGTFAHNALTHGVAGLNVDGGRIQGQTSTIRHNGGGLGKYGIYNPSDGAGTTGSIQGRFPANVILDEEAGRLLDEQSGVLLSKWSEPNRGTGKDIDSTIFKGFKRSSSASFVGDTGGASRFFYCAKASRSERGEDNDHPTVKPIKLMEYLCKLTATPTGGTILDPFAGSFTTALAARNTGRRYVAIELDEHNCEIGKKRLSQGALNLQAS